MTHSHPLDRQQLDGFEMSSLYYIYMHVTVLCILKMLQPQSLQISPSDQVSVSLKRQLSRALS